MLQVRTDLKEYDVLPIQLMKRDLHEAEVVLEIRRGVDGSQ